MSSFADSLVEIRRLRRHVTFWRVIAFVAVALAILAATLRLAGGPLAGPFIARLRINGMISGQEETLKAIRDLRTSKASAVLVDLDSPGGTTAGSEEIYLELRRLAEKKPVAAVVGTMAASGAYIAALGTDRIFVRGNSIVGSIGVLVEFPNFSGLMDKVGVQFEEIKSSPLKAAPNGLTPTSPEARAAMAELVNDSYAWFKDLVKSRRSLTDDELAKVDDGRVFTGRQGLTLKLADEMGGEREAVDWFVKERKVQKDLPIRDAQPADAWTRFSLTSLASQTLESAGWRWASEMIKDSSSVTAGRGGGLMSVWRVGTQ